MKTDGGEEVWDLAKNSYLQAMIDKSIVVDAGTKGGEKFVPMQLVKSFEDNKSKIFSVFGEETYDLWSGWMDLLRASASDVAASQGNILNALVKGGVGGIASGGGLAVGGSAPVVVPVVNGFSFLLAKSMMNPKGIIRKYLSSGIPGAELVSEAAGPVSRVVLSDLNKKRKKPQEMLRP
jgi:hypothetical protein